MQSPATLVVGAGAEPLRRSIGPSAWAALEVMAARSTPGGDYLVVDLCVRDVALVLGLSKNAAHRAIRRLVDAGVATPTQSRCTVGRFLAGTYRLAIPPDAIRVTERNPTNPPPHDRPNRSQRAATSADRGLQLELLTGCD